MADPKVGDPEIAARLRRARTEAGYSKAAAFCRERFAHKAYATYASYENGGRAIPLEGLEQLAAILGVRFPWLRYGTGPMRETRGGGVPVRGIVTQSGRVLAEAMSDMELVAAPPGIGEDLVAYRVVGDANYPAYRENDLIFTAATGERDPQKLLGKECVVTLSDGSRWLRILRRGAQAGLFTLLALTGQITEDVSVDDAAPVVWVKRG